MAAPGEAIVGKDFNPGGAFWCTEHRNALAPESGGRLECTKNKRRGGERCHKPAIRGTDSCSTHAGMKTERAIALGRSRIDAWSALGEAAKRVDPGVAVLAMLQQSWLRAHMYGELLRRQVVAEGADPDEVADLDVKGLIGHRKAAAGAEGFIYEQSEEVRALVSLESSERDRVVKYAESAHKMGISDRMINLAEKWGDQVAGAVTLMLADLDLTPEQQERVPIVVQSHLGALELGS